MAERRPAATQDSRLDRARIVIPVFDRLTALDALGPNEVLGRVPGWRVQFVASEPGPKRTDTGATAIVADSGLEQAGPADVLLVPGGPGTRPLLGDERLLGWLRTASEAATWTTSVCTGSLLLGAAGLLEGRRATTHWLQLERLREFGAEPVAERVVVDGDLITSAGVSAGIDMALELVARLRSPRLAQRIQLAIEYDPHPPFDSGSTSTASRETVEAVAELAAESDEWLAGHRGGGLTRRRNRGPEAGR